MEDRWEVDPGFRRGDGQGVGRDEGSEDEGSEEDGSGMTVARMAVVRTTAFRLNGLTAHNQTSAAVPTEFNPLTEVKA